MSVEINVNLDNGFAISPVGSGDRDAYVKFLEDRKIYESTQGIPYPYTLKDVDGWIEQRMLKAQTSKITLFAIRKADGELIGTVDAGSRIVIGRDHISEIGYWLATPYWGKGIMTHAVSWLCNYAFDELGLLRLTAHVFSFNTASMRVLEKNGFRLEGILKKHHLKDGKFIDAHLYARVI